MKRLSHALFGLRRNEQGTALLLAGYHFVLLLVLYLLKPVRDGLFLTDRGTSELPIVFLLVAAATVPTSLFQRWLGRRFRSDRLTNRFALAHVVAIAALAGATAAEVPGAPYAVYIYVSIYGVVATSQFWVFAGSLLTSTESKRTFAMLNLGGILGAVAGGELTNAVLRSGSFPPVLLLAAAAALLAGSMPLVAWIRHIHETRAAEAEPASEAQEPDGGRIEGTGADGSPPHEAAAERPTGTASAEATTPGSVRQILSDYPLVRWIAGLVALLAVVSALLDYQLKTLALQAFGGEVELTAFMGRFYGRVSLVALLLQLGLSTGLRRTARSTAALWVLPVALALGSTALLLVPGLAAAAVLRGSEQSLKHSVDKTARELLYLPLPQAIKRRIKVPLDLVVDQVAYGFGGLLLLGLTAGLGVGPVGLSPLVLGLAALWGGAVWVVRRRYRQQYRRSLEGALHSAPPTAANVSSNGEGRRPTPATPATSAGEARDREARDGDDAPPRADALRGAAARATLRYIALSQHLALREDRASEDGEGGAGPPRATEASLRSERRRALRTLFETLVRLQPTGEVQVQARPDELRLALEALEHPSPDVRSDAVSFLDGLLPDTLRRLLIPVLDARDGPDVLEVAPAFHRFIDAGGRAGPGDRKRTDWPKEMPRLPTNQATDEAYADA